MNRLICPCLCQLTMEKLCRLKPLLSGLSPAVLRDLQWPDISEAAHCRCWRSLLTELKPGHRAMLYNAMQEVTPLLSVSRTSHAAFCIFSSLLIICCDSLSHEEFIDTAVEVARIWHVIWLNIIIIILSGLNLTVKYPIKTYRLSDINPPNLAPGFPDGVCFLPMCVKQHLCFLKSLYMCIVPAVVVVAGSTQRAAEHHSAGKLSAAVRASEEADRKPKRRSNPERYRLAQRRPLVTATGACLVSVQLCVLCCPTLLWCDNNRAAGCLRGEESATCFSFRSH